jgi:hypothetical protein
MHVAARLADYSWRHQRHRVLPLDGIQFVLAMQCNPLMELAEKRRNKSQPGLTSNNKSYTGVLHRECRVAFELRENY